MHNIISSLPPGYNGGNTTYYIASGTSGQYKVWAASKAKTLNAAKRAASRAQFFAGVNVYVGQQVGNSIKVIAVKYHPNPLNLGAQGKWQNV